MKEIDISESVPKISGLIEILEFDHTTNTKKLRKPLKAYDLREEFDNLDAKLLLRSDFCKKHPVTLTLKRFRCNACRCLVESVAALNEHCKGNKHEKAVAEFDPFQAKTDPYAAAEGSSKFLEKRPEKQKSGSKNRKRKPDLTLTLKEKLEAEKDEETCPILGLESVQEFRNPVNPSLPFMYKCGLFKCDGAWGNSHRFYNHLVSEKHLQSFFEELKNKNKNDINSMIGEDNQSCTEDKGLLERAQEFAKISKQEVNFKAVEVIEDEERYWIQADRGIYKESSAAAKCVNELLRSNSSNSTHNMKRKIDEVNSISNSSNVVTTLNGELVKTDVKKAKLETKALKAKRPGFTDERYNETTYYHEPENGLRKVYPYYFTFTTFTKGRWVGEKILEVFSREFRAHPSQEYERCINAGTLTVNYEKVSVDYRLKHNDLLANIVHRHEVPVSSETIRTIHMDDDLVVVNKPASIPVHPCGRYRHNTVVFILAKEHGLKNLRTIHRLDRLTSGLLLFGRNPRKAREMEQQIRTRQVQKEYVCRVDGNFPSETILCKEPIEVVSYKIGVCKVSPNGKDCLTEFRKLSFNGKTSVVLCRPRTGRMHQIRVHLQFLGYPVVNDPLYNHSVFGPERGKGGRIGKTDDQLIQDLISIHNAENWLGGPLDDAGPGYGGNDSAAGGLFASDNNFNAAGSRQSDNKAEDDKISITSATNEQAEKTNSANENEDYQRLENPLTSQPQSDVITANAARAETPDSACDLRSLPNSADSPSSNTSGTPANEFISKHDQVSGKENTEMEQQPIVQRFDPSKLSVDQHCYECKVKYRDPEPKDLVMFLHAWKYSGHDWSFQTELPDWAKEDWIEENTGKAGENQ